MVSGFTFKLRNLSPIFLILVSQCAIKVISDFLSWAVVVAHVLS